MAADKGYTFQLLTPEDIIGCCADLRIGISAANIKNPSKEVLRPIYESFLAIILPDQEDNENAAVAADSAFDGHHEIYEGGIVVGRFRKRLQRVMQNAGVRDFSMADLMKPTAARTREILSALINFAKFRELRLHRYVELSDQAENLTAQYEQTQAEWAAVREQTAALEAQRKREEPQRAETAARNAMTVIKLQSLHNEQDQLRVQAQGVKEESAALVAKTEAANFETLGLKQEIQHLRGQIVSSPQKLKDDIEHYKASNAAEQAALESAAERGRQLQAQLDAVAAVEATLSALTGTAASLVEDLERVMTAEAELAEHRSREERARTQTADAVAAEAMAERQLAATQDKIKRNDQQSKLKKEAAALALDKAREEHRGCEREFAAAKIKLDEYATATRTLTAKRDALLAEHEAEMSRMEGAYDTLRDGVREYHRGLFEAMAHGPAAPLPSAGPASLAGSVGMSGSMLGRSAGYGSTATAPLSIADFR